MLDRSFIGHEFNAFSVDVEKGKIKFFAKAIGEESPIYNDLAAAQQAGYKNIPAPPTFAMSLDMESKEFLPVLKLLKMDIARILHGSQGFEYPGCIYAGDTITVTSKIIDMFDKKNGQLEFVLLEYSYTNQDNELVAKAVNTLVYRNA